MSGFSRSPKVIKGALISIDFPISIPKIVQFQYNPDSVTRSITAFSEGGEGGSDRTETFRVRGPPKESMRMEIELDASEDLENPEQNIVTTQSGITPQLSALEMMLYPKSSLIEKNKSEAEQGVFEVQPLELPLTILMYGIQRILPVRIKSFEITEEAHDVNLNPIRAKISISLDILSYEDLDPNHPAYRLFFVYHLMKEVKSVAATINSSVDFLSSTNLNVNIGQTPF